MTPQQRKLMQVLIQPSYDRKVYMWINESNELTGLNYLQGEPGVPDWDVQPNPKLLKIYNGLSKIVIDLVQNALCYNHFIARINHTIEIFELEERPVPILVYFESINHMRLIEIPGDTSEEDYYDIVCRTVATTHAFKYIVLNRDFELSNLPTKFTE